MVERIFKDEMIKADYIQMAVGQGVFLMNPAQIFMYWVGLAGYGKSTLQDAFQEAFGSGGY